MTHTTGPLIHEGGNDYSFSTKSGDSSFWIRVGAITVYVVVRKTAVEVSMMPAGMEDVSSHSYGYMTYADAVQEHREYLQLLEDKVAEGK
jgi:hypothetical protein